MKVFRRCLEKWLIMLLVLILAVSNAIPVFAADKFNYRTAKIHSLKGDITVLKSGGEKSFSAFEGMSLAQGDTLTTGKDATVTLYIDDDKEVKIDENTKINMSELGGSVVKKNESTGIKLWFGKLVAGIKKKLNIRSKFEVKTPTTVAGARGTLFFVGQQGSQTDIAVLDGTVAVDNLSSPSLPPPPPLSGAGPGPTPAPTQKPVQLVLTANQQVNLNAAEPNPAAPAPQRVTQQSLDLFVLQSIREQAQQAPAGNQISVDPALLKGIDQVINQKQEEKKKDDEKKAEEEKKTDQAQQKEQAAAVIHDPEVMPSPTPSPTSAPVSTPAPSSTPTPSPTPLPPPTLPPSSLSQPAVSDITVVNNASYYDYVAVSGASTVDRVKIYDSLNASVPLDTITGGSGVVYSQLMGLGNLGGSIYVAYVKNGVESARTQKTYGASGTTSSASLDSANVSITGPVGGNAASVTVTGLQPGDLVVVYDPTLSNVLGYKIHPLSPSCSSETVELQSAGLTASSNVYVGVNESGKTMSNWVWNTLTTYVSANAKDNLSGTDYMMFYNLMQGDVVKVYSDETGGTLLGTSLAAPSDYSSATVDITSGFPSGASDVYFTITGAGTNRFESMRAKQSLTNMFFAQSVSASPPPLSISSPVNPYIPSGPKTCQFLYSFGTTLSNTAHGTYCLSGTYAVTNNKLAIKMDHISSGLTASDFLTIKLFAFEKDGAGNFKADLLQDVADGTISSIINGEALITFNFHSSINLSTSDENKFVLCMDLGSHWSTGATFGFPNNAVDWQIESTDNSNRLHALCSTPGIVYTAKDTSEFAAALSDLDIHASGWPNSIQGFNSSELGYGIGTVANSLQMIVTPDVGTTVTACRGTMTITLSSNYGIVGFSAGSNGYHVINIIVCDGTNFDRVYTILVQVAVPN